MTLIERLEQAEGPDRELDQEVAIWFKNLGSERKVIGVANCAAYTSSIDAAMTLVPEGWTYTLVTSPPDHKPWASVREWRYSDERERFETSKACAESGEVKAATPALALCTAALKAQEARDK